MRTLKFDDLNLSPEILNGLKDVQHDEVTPLQESLIPPILEGKDAVVKAEPGIDKERTIVITVLEKFLKTDEKKGTHIIILSPNAQGSQKINEHIMSMGYHTGVECTSLDREGNLEEQQRAISEGIPVLTAEPDHLINILQDNKVILRHIDLLIIDGIDEMLNMNLEGKLKDIYKRILSNPQKLLLTQKLDSNTKIFVNSLLNEPVIVGFDNNQKDGRTLSEPPTISPDLSQGYIYVPNRMKITTLVAHIESSPSERCVIFTASKRGTDRLYRILRKHGLKATSLHDKLSDEKRAQRFANFTNGDVQYLLVSDIPAAELDLGSVKQVINYDVPNDPNEYRFRASMVGSGKATRIVSLVSKQDRSDISQLENELGQAPQELALPAKVQDKLKQRKNKGRGNKGRNKRQNSRNGNRKSGRQKKKKENKMELPRPSYDKLSGGRSGDKDERSSVVEFFRKLFS